MSQGGLGLPNIWLYYLSARLAQTAQWHAPPDSIPWLQFEISSVCPYYVPGLLWQTVLKPREIGVLNNIVGQTIHLWSLYHHKCNLRSWRPPLTSFIGVPRFPPAFRSPNDFLWWEHNFLTTLTALTHDTHFYSFAQLQEQFDIPRTKFYTFLQIRHFFESLYTLNAHPSMSTYKSVCKNLSREKELFLPYINSLMNYTSLRNLLLWPSGSPIWAWYFPLRTE